MKTPLEKLENLKPIPKWAILPLFDRVVWKRVQFGYVLESFNQEEHDQKEVGIQRCRQELALFLKRCATQQLSNFLTPMHDIFPPNESRSEVCL